MNNLSDERLKELSNVKMICMCQDEEYQSMARELLAYREARRRQVNTAQGYREAVRRQVNRAQGERKPVRPGDLQRKIHILNAIHNVDPEDLGYLWLKTWRNHRPNKYCLMVKGYCGDLIGSLWLTASEMMAHLEHKDWRNVLRAARGESRWQENMR